MSISKKKWPFIVRVNLGILGYIKFRDRNNFRRCFPCLLKHRGFGILHELFSIAEGDTAENEGTGDLTASCSICTDLNKTWQDGRSKEDDIDRRELTISGETKSTQTDPSPFSERTPLINGCKFDKQANRVNIQVSDNTAHCTSNGNENKKSPLVPWILFFTWLVIITGLMFSDWVVRIVSNWGKRDLTLHLLSASTYVLPLVVVTSIRMVSMIYEWAPPTKNWWVYALTKGNVLTRLNVLDLSRYTAFGYLSVSFFLVCACFELTYHFYRFSKCHDLHVKDYTDLAAFLIGEFMFAAFCYEIHLLKRCLQSDMKLCLSFVKRNIENGLDLCRQRILATYSEFLKLHSLVSSWLVFQFSISVFKLSCHIYWNYNVFAVNTDVIPAILINVVIWCESMMFLLLPTFAVGGFSISYLWNDFKLDCKRLQRKKEGENWHRVVRLLKTLNVTESGIYLTAFFSILSVFSALHLGSQYAEYWRDNIVNVTAAHPSFSFSENRTFTC
ncbi:uncharacterized protein [Ptychodera flava]|uniref:uncharacterized protein n=1 Tax=Ptychodera flava TaxID=63121 RepID=UPI00396A6380